MKAYNIIDIADRTGNDGRQDLKLYTWEQVLDYFRPDANEFPELAEEFKQVKNLPDLEEYLEHEADGMAVNYRIQEAEEVESIEAMQRANQFFANAR